MKISLEQLYLKFTQSLMKSDSNSFIMYVMQNNKVKNYILNFFDSLYEKALDVDNCWFYKNCCYLYLFVNNKDCFKKLELSKIFDVFFDRDADLPELEHL